MDCQNLPSYNKRWACSSRRMWGLWCLLWSLHAQGDWSHEDVGYWKLWIYIKIYKDTSFPKFECSRHRSWVLNKMEGMLNTSLSDQDCLIHNGFLLWGPKVSLDLRIFQSSSYGPKNIPKPCESTPRSSMIDTESWFLTEKKNLLWPQLPKGYPICPEALCPLVDLSSWCLSVESITELQSTLSAGPFGHVVTMALWDSLA